MNLVKYKGARSRDHSFLHLKEAYIAFSRLEGEATVAITFLSKCEGGTGNRFFVFFHFPLLSLSLRQKREERRCLAATSPYSVGRYSSSVLHAYRNGCLFGQLVQDAVSSRKFDNQEPLFTLIYHIAAEDKETERHQGATPVPKTGTIPYNLYPKGAERRANLCGRSGHAFALAIRYRRHRVSRQGLDHPPRRSESFPLGPCPYQC